MLFFTYCIFFFQHFKYLDPWLRSCTSSGIISGSSAFYPGFRILHPASRTAVLSISTSHVYQSFLASCSSVLQKFYSSVRCILKLCPPSSSYISAETAVLRPPWNLSPRSLSFQETNFITVCLAWHGQGHLSTLVSRLHPVSAEQDPDTRQILSTNCIPISGRRFTHIDSH